MNLNPRNLGGSTLLSVSCRETCLLVWWCVGDMCGMAGSDEDQGRSRFAPCIRKRGARVSWFILKTKVDSFSWFGLKTSGYGSGCWTLNPLSRVSLLVPQNRRLRFGDLAQKITTTVSWCVPQNQVGGGLLVCASKTDERMKMVWGHASTFGGLFCREASQAKVSHFCLKTGGGATVGGAHGIIAEVTWKWSKRRSDRWRWVRHSGSRTILPFIT
jgi:hypothetical protein